MANEDQTLIFRSSFSYEIVGAGSQDQPVTVELHTPIFP